MLRPPSRERPSYTIRLANSERRVLEAAAVEHREYLAEFIRRTALQAARRELIGPQDEAVEPAPPLAIIQARMGSKRLPGKMIKMLGDHPLIWHAWHAASEAFGARNVVFAIPASSENDVLANVIDDMDTDGHQTNLFRWPGPESDVLGRFHMCAHTYRWHPLSVIVRITPDDPFKDPRKMWDVVFGGTRHPVEISCEAFTLDTLSVAHNTIENLDQREHITHALFPVGPPPAPAGTWTIDTPDDLKRARKVLKMRSEGV